MLLQTRIFFLFQTIRLLIVDFCSSASCWTTFKYLKNWKLLYFLLLRTLGSIEFYPWAVPYRSFGQWFYSSQIRETAYMSLMLPSDILPYVAYHRRMPSFFEDDSSSLSSIGHRSLTNARMLCVSHICIGHKPLRCKFSIWYFCFVNRELCHLLHVTRYFLTYSFTASFFVFNQ